MKAHIVDLIKTTNTSVLQIYTPENRICFSLMISHDMKTRLPWQTEWLWPDAQHAPDTYFLFVPLSYQPTEQQEETTKLPASQNLNSWYGKLLRMKYDEKLGEMIPALHNPFYSRQFSDSTARSWVWCFGLPDNAAQVLRRLQRGRNYAQPSSHGILPDLIWDALPTAERKKPLLLAPSQAQET